jgi:DNA-binding response OmpR family regulator
MAPSPTRTVLIADDSAVARLTIARRVRAAGFDVVEHDSVASARTVDPSTLACALLDFDLGDGKGPEIAAELRKASATLPIAFFTSETTASIESDTSSFGPVFAKPAELDQALDWIARHTRST